MAEQIFFCELLDHLPNLLNYLRVRLVQHPKEHLDFLHIEMLISPEHRRPNIVDEVHYALVDLIQANQVFLCQFPIYALLQLILQLLQLVVSLVRVCQVIHETV